MNKTPQEIADEIMRDCGISFSPNIYLSGQIAKKLEAFALENHKNGMGEAVKIAKAQKECSAWADNIDYKVGCNNVKTAIERARNAKTTLP